MQILLFASRVAACTLFACTAALAAPTVPLVSGQAVNFNLPGNGFTNSFYIDVPASSQRLTLQLTGNAGAGDIDLLLNSAAAFPDLVGGQPPTASQLFDAAQYRSASIEPNERLAISRSNVFPVRAGRWFISVVNFESTGATPTLVATLSDAPPGAVPIEVVFNDASSSDPDDTCNIAEWNNQASRAPVNGNSGTTLGAQRQNAVREAIRIIGNELKSDVPIRVQACWDDLGGGTTFTLAQAGPRNLLAQESWMPRSGTWYAVAPATKLGGAQQCGLIGGDCERSYDIRATFNTQVDTDSIQSDFYYGFTGNGPFGTVDFIAVAMHEIAHGLGFISTINTRSAEGPVGERLQAGQGGPRYDDAFGHNLVVVNVDNATTRRFMDITDAERAAAITGIDRLRWDEARAVNSSFNLAAGFGAPQSFIFMHTPAPIVPGSSLSHVGIRQSGDLMLAQASRGNRSLQLTAPMLEGVGWSTTPQSVALPPSNIYYDIQRDGHGIAFERVQGSLYVLTFYTYAANGEPEWYQALGNMVNGVFVPITTTVGAEGKSLLRYRYTPGTMPPQRVDAAQSGTIALDFNNPGAQAPCNDGRATDSLVAVMTFSLGADQNVKWCMAPIVDAASLPTGAFSGLWAAGAGDDGWGWSTVGLVAGTDPTLFGLLFYYDGNGQSSWALTAQTGFIGDSTVKHRRGYCRTCPFTPWVDQTAGSVNFRFTANRVDYDVTPQNAVGGRFARTNSPFFRLTEPR